MKVGARTGFSQFYVGPGPALVDGRRCMEIIPVIGGRVFSEQVIIDPGDSSAPVFDAHGIVHGMVSAKLKYEEVGFIVLMSDIIKAAAEISLRRETMLRRVSTSAFCKGQSNSFRKTPKVKRSRRLGFADFVSNFWRMFFIAVSQSPKAGRHCLVTDIRVGS
jgi:hypothetical protein